MDGIIFDVDGTIWDTTKVIAKAWTNAINDHSDLEITVTVADLEGLFGKTMEEIYATIFPGLSIDERDRITEKCIEYEHKALEHESGQLYDGIIEAIKTLATKYPLYVVSNCQSGYIPLMLQITGLEDYFQDYLCYGDTLQPKTYTIPKIMERNGLKQAIYIGDILGDFQACEEIGIPFIHVTYGFGKVEDAKWKVDHPSELVDMVERVGLA